MRHALDHHRSQFSSGRSLALISQLLSRRVTKIASPNKLFSGNNSPSREVEQTFRGDVLHPSSCIGTILTTAGGLLHASRTCRQSISMHRVNFHKIAAGFYEGELAGFVELHAIRHLACRVGDARVYSCKCKYTYIHKRAIISFYLLLY